MGYLPGKFHGDDHGVHGSKYCLEWIQMVIFWEQSLVLVWFLTLTLLQFGCFRYVDLGICLYSFMFILGITGGITSIVLSAYTCRAVCCRRSKLGTVLYNPAAAGAAGAPQAIPLGNLDPSKFIATTQQTSGLASQQQRPPSYSTVIQPSYNQPNVPTGAGQTDLEGSTLVNGNFNNYIPDCI